MGTPLLWRYLVRNYLQIFFLCVSGFISILLVMRFQTIARFAATGASKLFVLKFVLLQIPYVLPFAIPISCLIASLILFQKMSRSHELTSLRSAGLSLPQIAFPLIAAGAVLTVANFAIVSEVAPRCRTHSKSLAHQMTAINPLCLLQKQKMIKLKNSFLDMKVLKSGKYAEDVVFVMRNYTNQRLGLTLAKKVTLSDGMLVGDDVTFISSVDPKKSDCFDHLVIENQGEMVTGADQLSHYLRSNEWSVNYENLNLRLLQAKKQVEHGKGAKFSSRAIQEIARRFSVGLAAFTFTFVGIAFGMEISRTRSIRGILFASGLMIFYLVTYLSAKAIRHDWQATLALFLLPHPLILFVSWRFLNRHAKGAS